MTEFSPKSVRFVGTIILSGSVENVFPLFSPLGERHWVPDWNPELLHPAGATWEEGLVFRTLEEQGEAIWIVMHLNRARHQVEYHRVEAGRYVARVRVRCSALSATTTEAAVVYEFIGLSEAGNREIAAMTQEGYADKMARWTRWINGYLAARASQVGRVDAPGAPAD